jgi:hypothetical protein
MNTCCHFPLGFVSGYVLLVYPDDARCVREGAKSQARILSYRHRAIPKAFLPQQPQLNKQKQKERELWVSEEPPLMASFMVGGSARLLYPDRQWQSVSVFWLLKMFEAKKAKRFD